MLDEMKLLSVISDRMEQIENEFDFELQGMQEILKGGYTLKNRVYILIEKAERLKPLINEYERIEKYKKPLIKESEFLTLLSDKVMKSFGLENNENEPS